jgi:hypothetical protein
MPRFSGETAAWLTCANCTLTPNARSPYNNVMCEPYQPDDDLADMLAEVRDAHASVAKFGGQIVLNVSPGGGEVKITMTAHRRTVKVGSGPLVRQARQSV